MRVIEKIKKIVKHGNTLAIHWGFCFSRACISVLKFWQCSVFSSLTFFQFFFFKTRNYESWNITWLFLLFSLRISPLTLPHNKPVVDQFLASCFSPSRQTNKLKETLQGTQSNLPINPWTDFHNCTLQLPRVINKELILIISIYDLANMLWEYSKLIRKNLTPNSCDQLKRKCVAAGGES